MHPNSLMIHPDSQSSLRIVIQTSISPFTFIQTSFYTVHPVIPITSLFSSYPSIKIVHPESSMHSEICGVFFFFEHAFRGIDLLVHTTCTLVCIISIFIWTPPSTLSWN